MTNITFVDEHDNIIGYGSKTEAQEKNIIHRIVRIFVLNTKGEILIQKRSPNVAVPNRWDQSAAGHVDEGESYNFAASRELQEEVGISNAHLLVIAKYYSQETDDLVIRKRFNTIYMTTYDGALYLSSEEVSETKWIMPSELKAWMQKRPQDFTQGFLEAYKHFSLK